MLVFVGLNVNKYFSVLTYLCINKTNIAYTDNYHKPVAACHLAVILYLSQLADTATRRIRSGAGLATVLTSPVPSELM